MQIVRTYYNEAKFEEATYIRYEKDIQFLEVVAGGDEEMASQLFRNEPDAWKHASVFRFALRIAAGESHTVLFRRLLAIQASRDFDVSEHLPWLYKEATSSDNNVLLKSILAIGIAPDTTFDDEYHKSTYLPGTNRRERRKLNQVSTFLHATARRGFVRSVKLLLENGADPRLLTIPRDQKEQQFNALEYAIYLKRYAVVEVLVDHGVRTREEWTRSNLFRRPRSWPVWAMKIFIEQHGSLINATGSSGWSLLDIVIARRSGVEIVEFLINKGADVNMRSSHDEPSLLHEAASYHKGGISIVELLINAHAKLEARGYGGKTPLHTAAGSWSSDGPAIVKMLLDAHANLEARDNNRETPLHTAAGSWSSDQQVGPTIVKMLLDAHANLEARDNNGKTPLHTAAGGLSSGGPAIVKMLLDAHANLEARDNNGKTPLHTVAGNQSSGGPAIVKMLLDAHANLEARDNNGKTPLHIAAGGLSSGGPAIVKMLLDARANIEARNPENTTPLGRLVFVAQLWGWSRSRNVIAKLLIDVGAHVEKSWDIKEGARGLFGMDSM